MQDADLDFVLEELAWACHSERLIVFAGAAFSAAAGLPADANLVDLLIHETWRSDRNRTGIDRNRTEKQQIIELASRGQWADALSHVRNVLGRNEFHHRIETLLDDDAVELPAMTRALAALAPRLHAILTTSIDHTLDRALAGTWTSFTTITGDITQRRQYILKLRGTLRDHSTWVLTREDYERVLYDIRRLDVLTALFRARTILFLGYDFSDPDIERVLERLRATSDGQPPRHFAVLPRSGLPPGRAEQLQASGVHLIQVAEVNRDSTAASLLTLLARCTADSDRPAHVPHPYRPLAVSEPASSDTCPFPGLGHFTEEQAHFFFGRESEIADALQKLGDTDSGHKRWLYIDGPSGVGKSSFVRAGLMPRVRTGHIIGTHPNWLVAIMRPGACPVTNLAHAVHAASRSHLPGGNGLNDLLDALRHHSETALASFLRQYVPSGHGILLVIDQLEETFTLAGDEECKRFDTLLATALSDHSGPLYLVTTVRSDFAANISELPHLETLLNRDASRFYLKPLGVSGLRAAIVHPARQIGLEWEEHLVGRIIRDASRSEGSLPLVAHVLQALWLERHGSRLTFAAYERLGGVEGALTRSADAILNKLSAPDQTCARELLLCLVTVGRRDAYTRQPVERERAIRAAGDGKSAERILLHLSGGRCQDTPASTPGPHPRLIVVTRHRDHDRVDLVHEALLTHWATLRLWLDENRKDLLVHDDLRARLETWKRAGSPSRALPEGGELQYLLCARRTSDEERQFLQSAHQRERHRRLRGRVLLAVLATAVLAVSWLALYAFQRRDEARASAKTAAANAQKAIDNKQKADANAKTAKANEREAAASEQKALAAASDARREASRAQQESRRADKANQRLTSTIAQLRIETSRTQQALAEAEENRRRAQENAEKAARLQRNAEALASDLEIRLHKEQQTRAELERFLRDGVLFTTLE